MTSAKLSRCTLTLVGRFTYLGPVISQRMTNDDDDIKKQATKVTVTANTLLRRFSLCSLEVKLVVQEPLLLQLAVVTAPP